MDIKIEDPRINAEEIKKTSSNKPENRLPKWMKSPMPKGKTFSQVNNLIRDNKLHTICSSGNCPNRGECWNAGTASFMILGNKCTRNCSFCDVLNLIPDKVDWDEPERLAQTIHTLGIKHCVITSVTRDDLEDGGAAFWAATIKEIKKQNPKTTLEALIPDFLGNTLDVDKVINASPEVISHNLETVKRLSPKIRSSARYERSLAVLKHIANSGLVAKSGIMVGIGEHPDEVLETMHDMRQNGVKVVTIGQYLQPQRYLLPVKEFITPEQFEEYRVAGEAMGFSFVESSPLVRSSYHAERHVKA